MKNFFLIVFVLIQHLLLAQVGVQTTAPSVNSVLDLTSSSKGFLLPRLTTVQRTGMVPSSILDKGLMVFDDTLNSIWYWNGLVWTKTSVLNVYEGDGDVAPSAITNRICGFTNGGSLDFDVNTVYIDATANRVGLGTNSPLASLHLTTDVRVGTAGIGYLRSLEGTVASTAYIEFYRANGVRNGYLGADNLNMYYNAENSANHLFFGGKVGVLISPSARFHVNQLTGDTTDLIVAQINNCGQPCFEATARNLVLSNGNGTNTRFAYISFVPGATLSGVDIVAIDRDKTNHYAGFDILTRNSTNFASRLTIKSNGNIGIGDNNPNQPLKMASGAFVNNAGNWINASDLRLKTDVKPLKYNLNTIKLLDPVHYVMNIDKSEQVGLIAQDVKKVIPEVVSGIEGDIDKGETLGISYNNLIPVLIKAIQEQQEQLIKLKNELKLLKQ